MAHPEDRSTLSLQNTQHVPVQEKDIVPPFDDPHDADAESLDLLIEDLEQQDGKEKEPDTLTIHTGIETATDAYGPHPLETDHERGLTDAEVLLARRKHGWNRMKEEKKRHIVKFLLLFVGPVQFVMEVSHPDRIIYAFSPGINYFPLYRLQLYWPPVSRIGLTLVLFWVCCY